MRREIQHLRDIAEERSLRAAKSGDRDSATAWERIGIRLNDLQELIASDWKVIQERQPEEAEALPGYIVGYLGAGVYVDNKRGECIARLG